MQKISKKVIAIFFIFIWSFANISQAETLYLFGGVGISDYEIATKDKSEINNKLTSLGFGSANTVTDTENLSHKFGVGVKIPLLLSIEASYENLGEISFNSTLDNFSLSLKCFLVVSNDFVFFIKLFFLF